MKLTLTAVITCDIDIDTDQIATTDGHEIPSAMLLGSWRLHL